MNEQATTTAPPALVTRSEDMPAGAEQAAVPAAAWAARLVAFGPQPELHQPRARAPFPWRSILGYIGDVLCITKSESARR